MQGRFLWLLSFGITILLLLLRDRLDFLRFVDDLGHTHLTLLDDLYRLVLFSQLQQVRVWFLGRSTGLGVDLLLTGRGVRAFVSGRPLADDPEVCLLRLKTAVLPLVVLAGVGVQGGDEGVFRLRALVELDLVNNLETCPVMGEPDQPAVARPEPVYLAVLQTDQVRTLRLHLEDVGNPPRAVLDQDHVQVGCDLEPRAVVGPVTISLARVCQSLHDLHLFFLTVDSVLEGGVHDVDDGEVAEEKVELLLLGKVGEGEGAAAVGEVALELGEAEAGDDAGGEVIEVVDASAVGAEHGLAAVELPALALGELVLRADHEVHHAHLPVDCELVHHDLVVGEADVQLGHVVGHLAQEGAREGPLPVEDELEHDLSVLVEAHLEHHQPLRLQHRHEVVLYHRRQRPHRGQRELLESHVAAPPHHPRRVQKGIIVTEDHLALRGLHYRGADHAAHLGGQQVTLRVRLALHYISQYFKGK